MSQSAMSSDLAELRDALEDAIGRAYCDGASEAITSPGHMRKIAAIQKAAWDVVQERVEPSAHDVRQWLRGLRRNVVQDLGDTTVRVRGTDHPEALVQEFDRWLSEGHDA